MQVGLGDGLGPEHVVLAGRSGTRVAARRQDAAVDDEMGDVDVLRRQLPRHALRQPAQAELAHGEGGGVGVALDAGRGAGELDRAAAARQHAPRRRLPHQEAAIAGDHQRLLHRRRVELGDRPLDAEARVVDDEVGHAEIAAQGLEQGVDILRPAGVAGMGAGTGLLGQCGKLVHLARR